MREIATYFLHAFVSVWTVREVAPKADLPRQLARRGRRFEDARSFVMCAALVAATTGGASGHGAHPFAFIQPWRGA